MNHIPTADPTTPPRPETKRWPGEKTVAERKARQSFYAQIYDPANFKPAKRT